MCLVLSPRSGSHAITVSLDVVWGKCLHRCLLQPTGRSHRHHRSHAFSLPLPVLVPISFHWSAIAASATTRSARNYRVHQDDRYNGEQHDEATSRKDLITGECDFDFLLEEVVVHFDDAMTRGDSDLKL